MNVNTLIKYKGHLYRIIGVIRDKRGKTALIRVNKKTIEIPENEINIFND